MIYIHSGSEESVLAPHMQIPEVGNLRIIFIPALFNKPCSPFVTIVSKPTTESRYPSGVPAGALCTPLVVSTCEIVPTAMQEGGIGY